MPLLLIPILIPVNMDMLFIQYGLFFYVYGVYLHWGYELPQLSAHNPFINTSYQVDLELLKFGRSYFLNNIFPILSKPVSKIV